MGIQFDSSYRLNYLSNSGRDLKTGSRLFRHETHFILAPVFPRVNRTHPESIGLLSEIGETNEIDGNFRFLSVFPVPPIHVSECDPIDSEWVLIDTRKNSCRFHGIKPTSGFQVPTGSGKVSQAIAQEVELYTVYSIHPKVFAEDQTIFAAFLSLQ